MHPVRFVPSLFTSCARAPIALLVTGQRTSCCFCREVYLQLFQSVLESVDFVQGQAHIAAEHTRSGVDQQAASEVILCHFILFLSEVDLAHSVPAAGTACCSSRGVCLKV